MALGNAYEQQIEDTKQRLIGYAQLLGNDYRSWDYIRSYGQPLAVVARKRDWITLIPGAAYRSRSGRAYLDELALHAMQGMF